MSEQQTLMAHIAAAYESDQRNGSATVKLRSELPVSYEAITDEWLTGVLCENSPGAEVTGHQLDAPDDGSSNRRKISVEYNAAGQGAGLPTALFCKASHGLSNRILLGLSGAAHSEAAFYNSVRPLLNIEAPQCYFARLDPDTFNSMIVLGDLSECGTEFCSHKTQMTRQRAESQMAVLAELHGNCYQSPAINAHLAQFTTWPEYFANTLAFGVKDASEQGFLDAEHLVPPALYRRKSEIWPATAASVERHRQLPPTLAHGDVHLKNWYVAETGTMGLSDWQCASRAHWGRDVAYTIATALTVEDRRDWERDLLRYYLDRMQAAGGPAVGFDEAWTHYRQQLMTALTWWTVTLSPSPELPDMQPRDITEEFVRRIATAMDDVDSLDSF